MKNPDENLEISMKNNEMIDSIPVNSFSNASKKSKIMLKIKFKKIRKGVLLIIRLILIQLKYK